MSTTRRGGRIRVLAGVLLVAGACVARAPGPFPAPPWLTTAAREHPLVGVVWSVAAGRAIGRDRLVAELAAADVVLLGDKHDNPDHHRLQAALLDALAAAGRPGPVVLEMVDVGRGAELAAVQAGSAVTPADVRDAVGGEKSGWDWDGYAPVIAAALAGDRPLVAGDLAPAAVGVLRRRGLDGLPAVTRRRLAVDVVTLTPAAMAGLAEDVRASHCGYAPPQTLPRMVDVQRARDARLARALVDARGVVLIAGAGHVRRDRAVPRYLQHWRPGVRLGVVAFLEVSPEVTDAAAAVAERFDGADAVDYVWFTPRVDLADPCEEFREQLERMRRPRD